MLVRLNSLNKLLAYTAFFCGLMPSFVNAQGLNLNIGEVNKAVIKTGFDVSADVSNIPVTFDLVETKIVKKGKKRVSKDVPNGCRVVGRAVPDKVRNKCYIYVDEVACGEQRIKTTGYIVGSDMNFGVVADTKTYNKVRYLHVEPGTVANFVVTGVAPAAQGASYAQN